MKTITFIIGLILTGFLLVKCTKGESAIPEPKAAVKPEPKKESPVKRGEYLVNSIGCDDCHSPKIMGPNGPEVDPTRRLSGHSSAAKLVPVKDKSILKDYALFNMEFTAAVGPWGTSFSANLTPDDTGIGSWTEAQFIKAIREGKYKGLDGGRPLLPPMPWFVYRNLTDEDLKAIFAFLKTLPPVSNVVPAPITPAG